ncbi:MAG: hypothetical protein IPG55_04440 [Saprospiraceae bacterium]|nr:hypothetical protein [Candidatus Defluviibacterium haderslevense]MBK7244869.1 hypothetical protein [Candidatus Defluviibacterium haderslevense]
MKNLLFLILSALLTFQCKEESSQEKILRLKSLISELSIHKSLSDSTGKKFEKVSFDSNEFLNFCKILDSSTLLKFSTVAMDFSIGEEINESIQSEYDKSLKFIPIDTFVAKAMVSSWVKKIDFYRFFHFQKRDSVERSVSFLAESLKNNIVNTKCKYVRFYFGEYNVDNEDIKNYLKNNEEPGSTYYSKNYKDRFSLIIAFFDENENIINNSTIVNLGGLCPPKCPPSAKDPFWLEK